MTTIEKLRKKRKRKNRTIAGSIAALIGICLHCCFGPKLPSEPLATATPAPTEVLYPTFTPTSTPTSTPTQTPVPSVAPRIISQGVNLRRGPGTLYALLGYLEPGTQAEVTGYNGGWWQISFEAETYWVYGELVSAYNIDGIPLVAAPPLPTQAPIATPTVTATPVCDCSSDIYNCSDFATQPQAQACHDYCMSLGRGDVHDLDGNDNAGLACESLPR